MADPRHPLRDNSRTLGLVQDRDADNAPGPEEANTTNGDDFARALDAALDAIRTAIDEEIEPQSAEPEPARTPQQPSGWSMPAMGQEATGSREQRAFREISSDIAARHPELRSTHDTGARPAPQRGTFMPAVATLASKPLARERAPQQPLTFDQPYAPAAPITQTRPASAPAAMRPAPAAPGFPANDSGANTHAPRQIGQQTSNIDRDAYWSALSADIESEFASQPTQPAPAAVAPAPAQAAPRARAVQPQDLPAFGKNHDDAPKQRRGTGRMLAVSAIALTAALGFAAAAVWLGNDLLNRDSGESINLAAATPASEPADSLPAATVENPARLEVGIIAGKAGEAIDLDVSLTAAPGERTAVLISGLPQDAKLSAGVDTGKGVWIVKPGDLRDLKLTVPPQTSSSGSIKFELVASNGLTLDVQTASLDVEPVAAPVASVAAEPVTAGLAPKPVKTAIVNFGSPDTAPVASIEAAPARNDAQLPAPPIAPRVDSTPPVSGGGGGGGVAVSQPVEPQVAEQPRQKQDEVVQTVSKSQAVTEPANPPVRVAAISPAATTPPSAPARVATPAPVSPDVQELVDRGNAMMQIGDLASARLFYERAAEAGSMDAALAMAKSYDPIYFEEEDVHGLPPNPEQAMQWYEKAEGLGSQEATSRMSALKARMQRS